MRKAVHNMVVTTALLTLLGGLCACTAAEEVKTGVVGQARGTEGMKGYLFSDQNDDSDQKAYYQDQRRRPINNPNSMGTGGGMPMGAGPYGAGQISPDMTGQPGVSGAQNGQPGTGFYPGMPDPQMMMQQYNSGNSTGGSGGGGAMDTYNDMLGRDRGTQGVNPFMVPQHAPDMKAVFEPMAYEVKSEKPKPAKHFKTHHFNESGFPLQQYAPKADAAVTGLDGQPQQNPQPKVVYPNLGNVPPTPEAFDKKEVLQKEMDTIIKEGDDANSKNEHIQSIPPEATTELSPESVTVIPKKTTNSEAPSEAAPAPRRRVGWHGESSAPAARAGH